MFNAALRSNCQLRGIGIIDLMMIHSIFVKVFLSVVVDCLSFYCSTTTTRPKCKVLHNRCQKCNKIAAKISEHFCFLKPFPLWTPHIVSFSAKLKPNKNFPTKQTAVKFHEDIYAPQRIYAVDFKESLNSSQHCNCSL